MRWPLKFLLEIALSLPLTFYWPKQSQGHFGLSHAGPVFLPQVRHLEKEVQLKKNVILDETIQIKLLVCRKKFHKGNISYLRALPMNLILRKHTSNYFTSSLNPLSLLLSFVLKVKPYDTGF